MLLMGTQERKKEKEEKNKHSSTFHSEFTGR